MQISGRRYEYLTIQPYGFLVGAKAAVHVALSSLDSDTPVVEFVNDQIQKRAFAPSVRPSQSIMSQPAAKRQKTSEQKDLEKRFKTIKTELKAVKDARKTPAIVVEDVDEFLTKFGESKGKRMKDFVLSITEMCMVKVIHGGSQVPVVQRRGQITADVETVGKVRVT